MKQTLALLLAAALAAAAWSQPVPIEVTNAKLPDSLRAVTGPDGEVLVDGSNVLILRMRYGKPEEPLAGKGYGENEMIIQRSVINPDSVMPGEIAIVLTSADMDEFWVPKQAIKGEKIILRVFASADTTFPSGTYYADSDIYKTPSLPGSIDGINFGEWKKIK